MAPPPLERSTSKVSISLPNPARIRTYLFRLPFFTRLCVLAIIAFWLLELQTVWSVIQWGSVIPNEIGFGGGTYRLNTFPFVHVGFWHMIIDLVAVVGLLERFEAEWGTLNCIALFLGPLSSLPGVLYVLIEKFVIRGNTPVAGMSVWIFLLLGVEAIKTWRMNPTFDVGGVKVPTWITPLVLIVFVAVLIPGSSFLGHLCSVLIGYLFGLGFLKFLAPPEKILRWIEGKLNLLGRLPHYVSVDQKTYGRYGVLPQSESGSLSSHNVPLGGTWLGAGSSSGGQRLGP